MQGMKRPQEINVVLYKRFAGRGSEADDAIQLIRQAHCQPSLLARPPVRAVGKKYGKKYVFGIPIVFKILDPYRQALQVSCYRGWKSRELHEARAEEVVRLAALDELWRGGNGYDWFAGMSGGEPAVLPTLCLLELYTMSETVRDAPSF